MQKEGKTLKRKKRQGERRILQKGEIGKKGRWNEERWDRGEKKKDRERREQD